MAKEIRVSFNPNFVEVLEEHKGQLDGYSPLQFAAYLFLNSPIQILGRGCFVKNIGFDLLKDGEKWNVAIYEPLEERLYFIEEFRKYIRSGETITPEDFTWWLQERLSYFGKVSIEKLTEEFMLKPHKKNVSK